MSKPKKLPYIAHHLKKKVQVANEAGEQVTIKTWSRSSTIYPEFIGHTFLVHCGNKHIPVTITPDRVGHKLGEFAPTRNFRGHVSKKNKGKK